LGYHCYLCLSRKLGFRAYATIPSCLMLLTKTLWIVKESCKIRCKEDKTPNDISFLSYSEGLILICIITDYVLSFTSIRNFRMFLFELYILENEVHWELIY
jgi:hypothetical protein